MARPTKQGIDYFPLDVDFFQDEKIRRIMKACGVGAPTILLSLLCNIYRKNGYYIEWDDRKPFLIADEVGVSEGTVIEVVNKALQVGFFSKKLMDEKKILTSAAIQQRFTEATAKRTSIIKNDDYWLLECEKGVISEKTRVIDEKTPVIAGDNPQSKVKESKEKTSTPDTAEGGAAGEKIPAELKGRKKVYAHDSKYYKAAAWLAQRVVENSPRKIRVPGETQIQQWADTFRLMETADKLPWDEIRTVLAWAVKNDFWHKQILSANNFRKHYTQLATKAGDSAGKSLSEDSQPPGYQDADEVIRDEAERLGIKL